ncbi:hypothetical protein BJ138DRAFT_185951 [Hygrophoropsis aurantiaca]|uniref:Uncharacterized protein n=1 Tax=Hygrophoropsis aurantiaca TaxID=72124 RepID=A0ACB7ZPS3_9AGAM|nr:hypothetical protein BJ138DRAFT_185951 [Hygrophoropsis aurantiaca]
MRGKTGLPTLETGISYRPHPASTLFDSAISSWPYPGAVPTAASHWQDAMGAMMKILDTRLNEQEVWFNARLYEQEAWFNDRLGEQKAWFDARLGEQEVWFDARLNEQDASFDAQLNEQKAEFTAQLNEQGAELNVRMDKLRTQLGEHGNALRRVCCFGWRVSSCDSANTAYWRSPGLSPRGILTAAHPATPCNSFIH